MQSRYFGRLSASDIAGMEPADVLHWAYYEKYMYQQDQAYELLTLLVKREGL